MYAYFRVNFKNLLVKNWGMPHFENNLLVLFKNRLSFCGVVLDHH